MAIAFYVGKGADPLCIKAMENQLNKHVDKNAQQVVRVNSFSDCARIAGFVKALVVPGGNASDMATNSGMENLDEIRDVLSLYHISYYGACAGAIFGASACIQRLWDGRCSFENAYFCYPKQTTYMKYFPGTTLAPLFSRKTVEITSEDLKLIPIQVGQDLFESVYVCGPGFMNVDTIPNAEIMTTFQNPPSSIHIVQKKQRDWIEIDPGKEKTVAESVFYENNGSKMVLTSSHPEIDSECVRSDLFRNSFQLSQKHQELFAEQVKVYDAVRERILRQNFEKLDIKLMPNTV